MICRYEFLYRKKEGKVNILCISYSDEGNKKTCVIHDFKKLIDYIKRHCIFTCDVCFYCFTTEDIQSILDGICDEIEYYEYSILNDHYYIMHQRQKTRSK